MSETKYDRLAYERPEAENEHLVSLIEKIAGTKDAALALATATERATKAEAGLSLAVRSLKGLCDEIGLTRDERHDAGLIPRRILQAAYEAENRINEPAIVAEAERLKALKRRITLLEWICDSCSIRTPIDGPPLVHDEGSLEAIRDRCVVPPAIAESGTEVKP